MSKFIYISVGAIGTAFFMILALLYKNILWVDMKIVLATGSVIAAICSAIAAFKSYFTARQLYYSQTTLKDDKEMFYVIAEISALYSRLNALYFGHDGEKESFDYIVNMDKKELIDETNYIFYNTNYPESFSKQISELIGVTSGWKYLIIRRYTHLLTDYSNISKILEIIYKTLGETYLKDGYGNKRAKNAIIIMKNEKLDKEAIAKNMEENKIRVEQWEIIARFYDTVFNNIIKTYGLKNPLFSKVISFEELRDDISLLILQSMCEGKKSIFDNIIDSDFIQKLDEPQKTIFQEVVNQFILLNEHKI